MYYLKSLNIKMWWWLDINADLFIVYSLFKAAVSNILVLVDFVTPVDTEG